MDVDKDDVQSPDKTLEKKGPDHKEDATSGLHEEEVDVENENKTNTKDANDSAMSSTQPISLNEADKTIGMSFDLFNVCCQ